MDHKTRETYRDSSVLSLLPYLFLCSAWFQLSIHAISDFYRALALESLKKDLSWLMTSTTSK